MEKQIIYVTDRNTLSEEIESALKRALGDQITERGKFIDDKLSLAAASKFANMSIPTFSKRVKEGVFNKHGSGRKIFFLRSEIIDSLTNSANRYE